MELEFATTGRDPEDDADIIVSIIGKYPRMGVAIDRWLQEGPGASGYLQFLEDFRDTPIEQF